MRTPHPLFIGATLIVVTACGGQHSPTTPSPRFVVGQGGNFATIGDALKVAQPDDTIQVRPGTYGERVTITVSGLKLQGDNAIIDGLAGGLNGTGFGMHLRGVSDVEVTGFVVQNFEVGIALENATNCRIHHNETRDNTDKTPPLDFWDGIRLIASRGNTISENFSHHNGDNGITLAGGSTDNVIRANRLSDNGPQAGIGTCGIIVIASGNNQNQIVDNEILRNGWGILFQPNAASNGNTIRNNQIHDGFRAGIALRPPANASTQNVIEDNDATGNGLANTDPTFAFDLFEGSVGGNTWRRNNGRANF